MNASTTIRPVNPTTPPRPIRLSEAEASILAGLAESLGMPPAVVDDELPNVEADPIDVGSDPETWPAWTDGWFYEPTDDDSAPHIDPEPTFVPTEADMAWFADPANRRRSRCPIAGARDPELTPSGLWA